MSEFSSTKLEGPSLKFGRDVIDDYPPRGLRKGGPYDVSFLSKDEFDVLLLYSKQNEEITKKFILKLKEGEYPFPGFSNLFKKSLRINQRIVTFRDDLFENEILNSIKEHGDKDLILLMLPQGSSISGDKIYFKGKLIFCSQGIPSQFASSNKIAGVMKSGGLGYYLQNFSLGIYAKLGQKPWVLHKPENLGSDIIVGVGGTRFHGKNRFAFTTLFERNGTFDWWSADMPKDPEDEEEYVNLLKHQITDAISDFKRQNPDYSVEKISFHISGKRPGKLERRAIVEIMEDLSEDFKFALFHINVTSPLWVLNETNGASFYHPIKGLKIRLSSKDFLITVDEPGKNPKAPIAPTRATLIEHNFESEEYKNIHEMVKEVYHLTRMNWRSVRAKNVPVSVYYPKILARFLEKFSYFDDHNNYLNALYSNISLKTKAWFL